MRFSYLIDQAEICTIHAQVVFISDRDPPEAGFSNLPQGDPFFNSERFHATVSSLFLSWMAQESLFQLYQEAADCCFICLIIHPVVDALQIQQAIGKQGVEVLGNGTRGELHFIGQLQAIILVAGKAMDNLKFALVAKEL